MFSSTGDTEVETKQNKDNKVPVFVDITFWGRRVTKKPISDGDEYQ